MKKNIFLFWSFLLFVTSPMISQNSDALVFDYLIDVNIQISSEGKITWELPEKIPSQFYQNDIVGFRIIIENKNNKPTPYFSLDYHPYRGPGGGALSPIVIEPDPDGDGGGFFLRSSNIFIPKDRALYLQSSLGETPIKLDLKYSTTGDPTSYIDMGEYSQIVTILSPLIRPPASISDNFRLYPNPVKNSLFIESQKPIDSKIQLLFYNANGFLIDKSSILIKESTLKYDGSKLKPGLYYCHIIQNDKKTVKTFIKL